MKETSTQLSQNPTSDKREKGPRTKTIKFLRDFARAYSYCVDPAISPELSGLILN